MSGAGGVMARIIGSKGHKARLKKIRGAAMTREVGKAIYAASDMLKAEAKISITTGAVSGKGHVPSAPGQPPNNDTGHLAGNIENRMTGPLTAEVSSNAEYSAALEFGTSRMAARPFMTPAAAKTRKQAGALVKAAVKKVTSGGAL